jgi:hypothetical protein
MNIIFLVDFYCDLHANGGTSLHQSIEEHSRRSRASVDVTFSVFLEHGAKGRGSVTGGALSHSGENWCGARHHGCIQHVPRVELVQCSGGSGGERRGDGLDRVK